jgi:DNA-binding SARP family transcriptional activator
MNTERSRSSLRLRLIGAFAICRQDRVLTPAVAGNRRARRLLALLAIHAGHVVGVDRIVHAMWDGAPPRDPVPNVATLVSRLRARLGTTVVQGDRRGGYRLDAAVPVDLHGANGLVIESRAVLASRRPAAALDIARRALIVLEESSVLIDERDVEWVESARRLHERTLRQARHVVSAAALDVGDPQAALDAAEAAIAADRFDEVAYRLMMSAYHASGEPARALLAYERLRATLVAELGAYPAPATQTLHLEILA